jgi:putative ABC transport system substrate-binding protein
MKKKLAMVLVVMMMLGLIFTGCGGTDSDTETAAKELPAIGIVQIVEHPSLDTIRENIISQLAEEGFIDGETVTIDYQNAQNEMSNLKTICQSFSSKNYDLIIAIATPSAQAALGETTEIPIIFSAVTDPMAAELVDSLEVPGGNVTGTSDAVSAQMIMDLALEITPDIKTIGALYNSSEVNSVSVVNDLKEYAASNGLTVIESAITNTSEVQQAAQFLAGKADAVFSPIDNTVASAMPIIVETLNNAKIPFYVGADSMVADGGLATYGINYVILGKETGKMAAEVLNGADTATMAVKTMSDMDIYVNKQTAKAIGIEIPQSVLDKATVLGE